MKSIIELIRAPFASFRQLTSGLRSAEDAAIKVRSLSSSIYLQTSKSSGIPGVPNSPNTTTPEESRRSRRYLA
jgi:hypothetical protein